MKFSPVTLVAFVASATAAIHGENSSRPRDHDFEGKKLRGRSPHAALAHHDFEDYDDRSYSEDQDGRSHFEGGTADANPRYWTGGVSEENKAPISCGNNLVNGMHCKGAYCDVSTLRCANEPDDEFFNLTPTAPSFTTAWFSEEKDHETYCPPGMWMTGLGCDGRYCDNLKLVCQQFKEVVPSSTCKWTGERLSEEDNQEFTSVLYSGSDYGYYVQGVGCYGKHYCDQRDLYVCKAQKIADLTVELGEGHWYLADSYNGELKLKFSTSWSTKTGSSETDTAVDKYAIEASINAGFTFKIKKLAGQTLGITVKGSYSKTLSHSLTTTFSQEYKESRTREMSCTGNLYAWKMTANKDADGGLGWTVNSHHALCIPIHGYGAPNCPPGQCDDDYCQVCKCSFVRDNDPDANVNCDASGNYVN